MAYTTQQIHDLIPTERTVSAEQVAELLGGVPVEPVLAELRSLAADRWIERTTRDGTERFWRYRL